MSSVSRLGRIADDVIAQMVAQDFFTAANLNCDSDVTPEFSYAYSLDIPTTNTEPQVILAPLDINPLRKGWGAENTHYRIGFGVVRRIADITSRAVLDPLTLCVENICAYLLADKKFDTTAECISASAVLGEALSDSLRNKNLFLVVIEVEFQDNLVVSFS